MSDSGACDLGHPVWTDGRHVHAPDEAAHVAAGTDVAVTEDAEVSGASNGSRKQKRLRPHERRNLMRDLAKDEQRSADLGRKYGITAAYVREFKMHHKQEIAEIAADLDNAFAGLWVADKEARIAFYQAELERIETIGHHEWVKAKAQLLKNVAEETGQLPPRMQISVMPVIHILENVDTEELK